MEEAKKKKSIMQLNKDSFLKNLREQEKQKVLDKLEMKRWTRTWCINVAAYLVIARIYKIISRRIRK